MAGRTIRIMKIAMALDEAEVSKNVGELNISLYLDMEKARTREYQM
jgi:hypothetical protein